MNTLQIVQNALILSNFVLMVVKAQIVILNTRVLVVTFSQLLRYRMTADIPQNILEQALCG